MYIDFADEICTLLTKNSQFSLILCKQRVCWYISNEVLSIGGWLCFASTGLSHWLQKEQPGQSTGTDEGTKPNNAHP